MGELIFTWWALWRRRGTLRMAFGCSARSGASRWARVRDASSAMSCLLIGLAFKEWDC